MTNNGCGKHNVQTLVQLPYGYYCNTAKQTGAYRSPPRLCYSWDRCFFVITLEI